MSLVSDQRGSAVVDFLLVVVPILAISLTTLGITWYSYARTVLLDATIEGARYAALADQDLAAGISRTQNLVKQSLGSVLRVEVLGSDTEVGSLRSVHLQSSAQVPLGGLLGSQFLVTTAEATGEQEY